MDSRITRAPQLLPLAAVLCIALPAFAGETIYYQTGEDGSIRLTNAPAEPGYHAYLAPGGLPGAPRTSPGLYAGPIQRASSRYGVDPDLVRAVISTESNYDPKAISPKGARGLMQLMPATARRFGVQDVFDPVQNILGGVRYLRHLLDLFGGDLVLALAAYNAGERVVQERGRVPNYPETRLYVDRVLERYGKRSGADPRQGTREEASLALPARKTRIYRTVSQDGVLIFSDSPVPRPVRD
jgi:soluble lytic murein transglycosylase-like protein